MLREENKRAVRVRVCGDVARFVEPEELERLALDELEPAAAVVVQPIKVWTLDAFLDEDCEQAA